MRVWGLHSKGGAGVSGLIIGGQGWASLQVAALAAGTHSLMNVAPCWNESEPSAWLMPLLPETLYLCNCLLGCMPHSIHPLTNYGAHL